MRVGKGEGWSWALGVVGLCEDGCSGCGGGDLSSFAGLGSVDSCGVGNPMTGGAGLAVVVVVWLVERKVWCYDGLIMSPRSVCRSTV